MGQLLRCMWQILSSFIFNRRFFWHKAVYKMSEVMVFNSQTYQFSESSSNRTYNLYLGMERAVHFRLWCGEGEKALFFFFYTLMKARQPLHGTQFDIPRQAAIH